MMNESHRLNLSDDLLKLLNKSQIILAKNWTGKFTRPSSHLYPHQWSWDSAFIALGYANYDQMRAQQELLSLFKGQWKNGLLPHIVFHTEGGDYFPGPEVWEIERHPSAPENIKTSGIIQPPFHATAALQIYRKAADKRDAKIFLKRIYPHLIKWHDYLYRERDPLGEGLVYICHPWESGQDNSPLWDPIISEYETGEQEIPQYHREDTREIPAAYRPEKRDYNFYVHLVNLFKQLNYSDSAIFRESPFLIQDVLFNTLLCQANRDLEEIARLIGENSTPHKERADRTAQAIQEKLWDKDHHIFVDWDLRNRRSIDVHVSAGFLPLFAEIPDRQQARLMFEYMDTHCFCRLSDNCYAIPSYDKCESNYSPVKYWRGPIWININWLLCHGLTKYGYDAYSNKVMHSIIDLPRYYGFFEYFDPDQGCGLGSDNFSWTAALLIDVLYSLPA